MLILAKEIELGKIGKNTVLSLAVMVNGTVKLSKIYLRAIESLLIIVVNESNDIYIIPRTYIIVADAFYYGYEFYGDYGELKLTEKEALEAKDFAMTAIIQYVFEEVDNRIDADYDFEQILGKLASSEILDELILIGFNEATYSRDNLESALENPNLSEKCLLFILDFCCGNDLSNYDCYDNYQSTIDEEMESLEDVDRISLLKGIIKHPNVTQEILEQLIDSEDEEVAEFAKEKLRQFDRTL